MANQPNGKPVTDEYVKEQTRALIVGVLGKDEQAPMFETTYEFLCGHHMLDNISYGEGCYSVELAIDALEERNPWDDHRLCESVAVCLFEIVMDDSYVNEYKSYAWHAGLPPLLKCMEKHPHAEGLYKHALLFMKAVQNINFTPGELGIRTSVLQTKRIMARVAWAIRNFFETQLSDYPEAILPTCCALIATMEEKNGSEIGIVEIFMEEAETPALLFRMLEHSPRLDYVVDGVRELLEAVMRRQSEYQRLGSYLRIRQAYWTETYNNAGYPGDDEEEKQSLMLRLVHCANSTADVVDI